MRKEKLVLNIAHLYPKLLNTYGDLGNILTIKKRCEWRGIDVVIDSIDIGESIDVNKYDFYFLGGGQDQHQVIVAKELQKHKTLLQDAKDSESVILAICGGYQLLGHYYQPNQGAEIPGISLLDVYTTASDSRFIGNVTEVCELLEQATLVGFENHCGSTYIQDGAKPLAKILVGNGNNGVDKTEGAYSKNVFGTYLHGSFLPKNVHFADYLISLALKKRYGADVVLTKLNDEIENRLHETLVSKKY